MIIVIFNLILGNSFYIAIFFGYLEFLMQNDTKMYKNVLNKIID